MNLARIPTELLFDTQSVRIEEVKGNVIYHKDVMSWWWYSIEKVSQAGEILPAKAPQKGTWQLWHAEG